MRFFILVFLILTVVRAFSQEGGTGPATIEIALLSNKYLDSIVNENEVVVSISTQNDPFTETMQVLKNGNRKAIFHFLISGTDTFSIKVSAYLTKSKMGNRYNHVYVWPKACRVKNVSLSPWETTRVSLVFPEACSYDRTFLDRICPRCHRDDMVKFYTRGCVVADPIGEEINDSYWDSGEPSSCMPNWYCERDELEY